MAAHTPFHVVSINHFDRSFFHASETVANGTVYPILDMNPMWEGDIFWKLVHTVTRNPPICLDILNYFQCLRPFTHCIRGMAN